MDSVPYKELTTSRGYIYSYLHIAPSSTSPYILFLHGFPSSSQDWRNQIRYFSAKGYGIVAPDLLGYENTSKPLDVYAYKGMVQDVVDILNHEKIDTMIGVAHDWGSFMLARLANYHSARFTKYVFLDVGYSAPGHSLTLDKLKFIDSQIHAALGYSVFGYFLFLGEHDAAELMDRNAESVASLFHSRDEDLGKKYMGAEGGFRAWLTEGKVADWPDYFSPEDRAQHMRQFSIEKGGYGPAINWYRAQIQNINEAEEKAIPQEDHILRHPTLLLTAQHNFITTAANFAEQMKAFAPLFTMKEVDCGHWIQIERVDEVNMVLQDFFAT